MPVTPVTFVSGSVVKSTTAPLVLVPAVVKAHESIAPVVSVTPEVLVTVDSPSTSVTGSTQGSLPMLVIGLNLPLITPYSLTKRINGTNGTVMIMNGRRNYPPPLRGAG